MVYHCFEIILVSLLLLDVFVSDRSEGKLDVNIIFENNIGGPVYNLTVCHQAPVGYDFKYDTQYFIRDSLDDGQSILKAIQLYKRQLEKQAMMECRLDTPYALYQNMLEDSSAKDELFELLGK